jgi:hypothetical protein
MLPSRQANWSPLCGGQMGSYKEAPPAKGVGGRLMSECLSSLGTAPASALARFMFWFAGIIVFPLMLIYTAVSLAVFRGKADRAAAHY